jgi:putative IMPACT (imprinted ancient) family translation regulator
MGTDRDHRRCAAHCVEKAQAADDEQDKALWLTLALSWLRLAEYAGGAASEHGSASDGQNALAAHAPD